MLTCLRAPGQASETSQMVKQQSLECPVCLEEKEEWLSIQCGHLICYGCVLDLMPKFDIGDSVSLKSYYTNNKHWSLSLWQTLT
jgi:Zinc finger, C3HC4 type (RING finger)